MIKSQSQVETHLKYLQDQLDKLKSVYSEYKSLPPTLKNQVDIEQVKLQILYKVNRILALKWVLNQVTDI